MEKYCSKCGITKEISQFNKNSRKQDGLQTCCRDCSKIANNLGYINNPNRKASIVARKKIIKKYNGLLIKRYKSFCGCKFCGEKEPVALDFHHLDPSEKDDNIGKMVTYSTSRLREEIRKCVVLCANCHRKLHAGILRL